MKRHNHLSVNEKERTNHSMKIYMVSLLHRATIITNGYKSNIEPT